MSKINLFIFNFQQLNQRNKILNTNEIFFISLILDRLIRLSEIKKFSNFDEKKKKRNTSFIFLFFSDNCNSSILKADLL